MRFSLAHKATARLTLTLLGYLSYQTEPDFTLDQGINRRTGNFFVTNDKFTATYLWTPRFSTATSYSLSALNYEDNAIGQFENRFENSFGNQFRYLILPSTSAVVEYRFQVTSYVDNPSRDSTTQFILAGLEHTFDPRLSGSLRAGAQFRDFDQGGSRSSPYFEGSLHYTLGKQTNVLWTNRYGIEEPEDAGSQSRETFRTGLTASHSFTPRIRGSLTGNYQHSTYQSNAAGPGIGTEDIFDLGLSLRYSITRYLGVQAGYNYTDVSSDIVFREYSRNRYWAGLNVTF